MRDASPLATRRRKGVAIILTTMSLMVTIPLAGLAVDLSTLYIIRGKLSAAVDAAVLAGARALSQGRDAAAQQLSAQNAATKFFNANFPAGYWGAANVTLSPPTIDDTSNPNYRIVSAIASATAPLYFMRILGQDTSTVAITGEAARRDVSMMLVLDRSYSMRNPFQGTTACAVMKQDAAYFLSLFAEGRDEVGLVAFGASTFVAPPTTDFDNSLPNFISQITCDGNTNTSQALWDAYQQLQNTNSPPNQRAKVIVLLTDGRPNGFTGDFLARRLNPSRCDPAGLPLKGVIAQWAGGPRPSGTTAGIMNWVQASITDASGDEYATANSNGCVFGPPGNRGNLTRLSDEIWGMPATDIHGNSLSGNYSLQNPNFPYNSSYANLSSVTVPREIIKASTNAADNMATTIRTDAVLTPSIYTIGLEGNDPNDPPDELFLRKVANDPSLEHDADPIARSFFRPGQPRGYFVAAPDPSQLSTAFNAIATQIVVRLSR